MANELRVRQNFIGGMVDDNPLTSGATTLTSAALAALVAVGSTQHLAITFDPDGQFGAPEIAYITAHTTSATTATILRGQEGTTARAHNQDVTWTHSPTILDYPGSGAKIYKSAGQSISSATNTDITFDLEEFDTDAYHDTVTNTHRLTVPSAGLYQIGYCLGTSTGINSSTERFVGTVYKGGNGVGTGVFVPGSRVEADTNASAAFPAIQGVFPVFAAAGDYYSLGIYTSSACTMDFTLCDFWILRVSR